MLFLRLSCAIVAASLAACSFGSYLLRGGTVVDGSGSRPRRADVRIVGDKIVEIGRLTPRKREVVVDARGLTVAPGFIDAHSHADSALDKLESQVRQGITTAIVGQDGSNARPLFEFFRHLEGNPPEINFAAFAGHGTARSRVMGDDFKRPATADEVERMADLIAADMRLGALGLSSGLEYDPGHYSTTDELVSLAKMAGRHGGMYISHLRDEGAGVLKSLDELLKISKGADLAAQVSHIKVAVTSVWGKSKQALRRLQDARQSGLKVTADVYPYTFWQSSITAMTIERTWDDPGMWERALKENGGPERVTLVTYSPQPEWEGKTLAELGRLTGTPPAQVCVEIVQKTRDGKAEESIQCEAMTEADLVTFLKWPSTMVCSDGTGGGRHPRGAGAFPRVLARYVREQKVLTLQEAIRKMTSLPAATFGLQGRGVLKTGAIADVVVFDPRRIRDRATPAEPTAFAIGVTHVFVNGERVLAGGQMTGKRPGMALRRVNAVRQGTSRG